MNELIQNFIIFKIIFFNNRMKHFLSYLQKIKIILSAGVYKKNKKLRDKISQKLNELFVDCVNNNRKENTKCLSLDDLYKETFKVDSVKDLYKNSSNKKYNHTI